MSTREPNIDDLPSGAKRLRLMFNGKVYRRTFETLEEAVRHREAVLELARAKDIAPSTGPTIKQLGGRFLGSRATNRNAKTDEGRWHKHIATSSLATMPVSSIDRHQVREWLERLAKKRTGYDEKRHGARELKPLSKQTQRHCLNLLRAFFAWALDQQEPYATTNPCADVRVHSADGDEEEGWQDTWYLDREEAHAFLSRFDELPDAHGRMDRLIVENLLYLGCRLGEAWCLHLEDVHVDGDDKHVVIRFGSFDRVKHRFRTPKGRKGSARTRKVPLWGPGLVAMQAWLAVLPSYAPHNPRGLVFPTQRGDLRDVKPPRSWKRVTEAHGVIPRIGRKPWAHLLRHTCATALLSGTWGVKWSLEDVQKVLGHQDLRTTQRYAKLTDEALFRRASGADDAWRRSHVAVMTSATSGPEVAKIAGHARQDSNLRPTAPEAVALSS